jgi:hypothetical protein
MDEAGISKPAQEPFVTVAGIIVHADNKLNAIEGQLDRILQRHIPEHQREGFVFHAMELFNGGGKVFKRPKREIVGPLEWPMERRFAIADEIAAIPKKFDLPIALSFIERAKFPKSFDLPPEWTEAQKTVAAHVSAFMASALVIEHWIRKNASNENCLLVAEDNAQARSIIRDVQQHHQDKKIEAVLDEKTRKHFPLRKIKEDPLFQSKRPSHPLVVADFCAYVFKRVLMGDTRYERFFDPFRQKIVTFEEEWLGRDRGRRFRSIPRSRQRQVSERLP